jgi:hypothetical protein
MARYERWISKHMRTYQQANGLLEDSEDLEIGMR